jgi:hypothetical protein
MYDVTRILSQIEVGDSEAAAQVQPLVNEEFSKTGTAKLAQKRPGQTLHATVLVLKA